MVTYLTPQELKRKELERVTMLEGIDLWKQQKEDNWRRNVKEKHEVRQMLENYWPWGKPGGGAPNPVGIGLKNMQMEDVFSVEEMKKAKRQVGAFQFGRPGGGAPHITKAGQKQIRFTEDPALRFQWGKDLRQTVDNTLRYRSRRDEQELYKKQLDALVEEKRKAKEIERKRKLEFERKMGWTSDATIHQLQDEIIKQSDNQKTNKTSHHCHSHCHHHHHHHRDENAANKENDRQYDKFGIELVPLLVRRRPHVLKVHLGTTDVTRGDAMPRRIQVAEPKYLNDLTQQVYHKSQRMKEAHVEDVKSCQQHFETWGNLWGRPGYGAPKPATKKGHLMSMLYPQMYPMPVN